MLNAYSQRFADVLFAAFPEWKVFAFEKLSEVFSGDTEGILVVDVPCPTNFEGGCFQNTLRIDTMYNEVTVSWDGYHAHFERFSSIMPNNEFDDVIVFINQLLEEELCIAVAQASGKWCGSMAIEPNETPSFHPSLEDVPYYIRSWRGTYDQPLTQ